ncbi:MAG: hypothetical protein JXQ82_01555 [Methanomicrobiaceae archaeon]|nr:hypothetical protein [Methanomicrobiaceae archaeon]
MSKGAMNIFAGELLLLRQNSEGCLILPSGNPVENVYVCGVITELQKNQKGQVTGARVADPTGVFRIYCGKDRAYCAEDLFSMKVPSFVSVYGEISAKVKGGVLEKEIIPESVCEITREERDLWIRGTALATIKRLERSFVVYDESYGIETLGIVEKALSVAESKEISDISSEGDNLDDICDRIMSFIAEISTKKGVLLDELYPVCESRGIKTEAVKKCLEKLLEDGELYLPSGGYVKIL